MGCGIRQANYDYGISGDCSIVSSGSGGVMSKHHTHGASTFVALGDGRGDLFVPFFPRCWSGKPKRFKNLHRKAEQFLRKYGREAFAKHYQCTGLS